MVAGVVALLALFGLAAAAAAVDPGPVARWTFDETGGAVAADAIGSLDGTIHGATPVVDGFDGGAFRFDGTDDVTVPGGANLRSPDMVVSMWVRGDAAEPPAAGQVLLDNGNVLCGGHGYALVATATWAQLIFRDAQANIGIWTLQPAASIGLPKLWDGAWHHVAIGSHADQYGFVYLFIDGWYVATTSGQPSDLTDGVGYGATPTFPFVIGDDDQGCGPGFQGDIDDVRVYSHLIDRGELAGLEPAIETSLQIVSVEPGAVRTDANITNWFDLDVSLQPTPAMPGSFWVYVTGEDGLERAIQRFDLGLGNLSADGHYDLAYFAEYGGDSTIRVAYVPEVPGLPSEDSETVQITKAASSTYVSFESVVLDDEPIRIGVSIHPTARVPATGTVELWDVTDVPALLGEAEVLNYPGSWLGSAVFDLPQRPAGEYTFEARYFGSAANLPSESVPTTLDVLPGLETGVVSINDGAATTDDPIVQVSAPATGAVALLITTDPNDLRRQYQLPYADSFTTWLTQPWYGDDADGVRTIWVKWADAKNRWSDWSTDTIVLARPPAGTVSIEGGAAYTTDNAVSVAVPIANAGSIESVQLSNDGKSWTTFDYQASVPWTLTPGSGQKSVRARWVNADGKASMSLADSIVFDNQPPTVTGIARGFAQGYQVSGGQVPLRLMWTGADSGSGIGRYELARSKDGSAFMTIAASLTSSTSVRAVKPGHTYRFRVRAVDNAGNHSAWAYGSTFHVSSAQESNSKVRYHRTWHTSYSTVHWGGATRYAKVGGASASITVDARSFAWVAPTGLTRGTAKVYVNGTLIATISLYSTAASEREIVFAKSWSTAATRTIKIKIAGTSGHPRVDVDALIWAT